MGAARCPAAATRHSNFETKQIRTFAGHTSAVTSVAFSGTPSGVLSVAFSPDGRSALSGSDDKTLKLWDLTRGH
jgi:WD40 repeat protein